MSCQYCNKYPHDIHCPNAPDPKIHGFCPICFEPLFDGYQDWIDNENNYFCSKECACKYHGIEEKEWEEK